MQLPTGPQVRLYGWRFERRRVGRVRRLLGMADELLHRQENVLLHDLLRNGRTVDDVFWNGPSRHSRVQRVGAFLIGLTLLFNSFVAVCVLYQKGARFLLFPIVAILVAGGRVMWMSVRGRRVE